MIADVVTNTTAKTSEDDLRRLLQFLDDNDLIVDTSPEAARKLAKKKARGRQHWLMWLLKNYLFMRVPLLRPDRYLTVLLPLARPFFSRGFVLASLMAALIGLALAVRQWEAFVHTFLYFLSWEGAVYYAMALFLAKVLHELGHAFAAKLNGCRVPTMGVAFLILWPVLYTDVTDAWRLKSRRERLRIGAAGIGVELNAGRMGYARLVLPTRWSVAQRLLSVGDGDLASDSGHQPQSLPAFRRLLSSFGLVRCPEHARARFCSGDAGTCAKRSSASTSLNQSTWAHGWSGA